MLRLAREIYDGVIDHARGKETEVCGVLGGDHGDPSTATTIRRAENVAADPRSEYRIDPGEQLALMESIEEEGRDVVGFYHSHPDGPAGTSATDAARAAWTGYSYVIVVLDGRYPFVGSWRWTGTAFKPEAVVLDG